MQKSFYPTAALIGLLLMVIGAMTTYIALGQDSGGDLATEAVEMTEEVVVTAVIVEPAAPVAEQVQPQNPAPAQVIVPTLPPPTLVPPTPVPPTPVPTEMPPTPIPTEVLQPTVEPVIPTEVPLVEVTEAVAAPVQAAQVEILPSPTIEMAAPFENVVSMEVTAEVQPPVENAVPAEVTTEAQPPAENAIPVEVTEIVVAPPVVEVTVEVVAPVENAAPVETTEVVAPPVVEVTEVVQPPVGREGMAGQNAEPVQPESVFTATPETIVPGAEATEEIAVPDNSSTEPLPEVTEPVAVVDPAVVPEVTEAVVDGLPAAESTETVLAPTAMIFGQVQQRQGQTVSAQLLLTSSTGEVLDLPVGEQGDFQIEGLVAGDYTLEAVAPGFLSRQMQFTLLDGETLELPLTILNAGDLNADNRVDLDDIVLMAANYDGPAVMVEADLNGDEWIDISDLTIIGAQFGTEGPLPWS